MNELKNQALYNYCNMLINRVWKLLPLREEKDTETLSKYVDSLVNELLAGAELFPEQNIFLETAMKLKNVTVLEHQAFSKTSLFRKRILEAIDSIEKEKRRLYACPTSK